MNLILFFFKAILTLKYLHTVTNEAVCRYESVCTGIHADRYSMLTGKQDKRTTWEALEPEVYYNGMKHLLTSSFYC